MATGVGRVDAAPLQKTARRVLGLPMRARMRGAAALLIVIGVAGLLASPPAALAASPAAEAETLIRDGVALRRQQRDVQALPLFQKAYDLVRNPRTAGQLGLCELSVGYWIEAEQHLKEALAVPGHPWVEKNKASLETSLKRARDNIGQLAISGAPDGAQVYVNSHLVGRLPLREPLRLARGVVDVELRAPGYVSSHRSLSITAETANLELKLEREKVAVVEPPKPPAQKLPPRLLETPETKPREESPATVDPESAPHPGRAMRWVAVGTAVLAGAALVGAGVETVRWQSGVADFDNHKTNDQVDCAISGRPLRGGPDCQALYDQFTADKRLAIIGYAVGGALAVTSVTLWLVAPRSSAASERVAFGCAPTLADPGLSCRLSF